MKNTRKNPVADPHSGIPHSAVTDSLLAGGPEGMGLLGPLAEQARLHYRRGLEGAVNTVRAYAADVRGFEAFCHRHGLAPCPASQQTLALFITELAESGARYATLMRKLAAIAKCHRLAGCDSPTGSETVKTLLRGIATRIGTAQKQAPAAEKDTLRAVVDAIGEDTLTGLRDKVILVLGFTGAFRRSELVAVDIEHLSFEKECLLLRIPRSKTNQTGAGQHKAVFYSPYAQVCPVRLVERYVEALAARTGRRSGPLLVNIRKGDHPTPDRLTAQSVDKVVKKYLGTGYSSHSLRATFVTVSKLAGADDQEVMVQGGWKTTSMIRRYNRVNDVKRYNAARKLGW